ncbi:MAG: DinB family protein [Caldilineaceae bacterium]
MSQRAQALVNRFEAANKAMINYVESCSEEELNKITDSEGWPVRVAANHIAVSHEPVVGLAQLIATGAPLPPLTMEMIHQGNAQHAAQFADVSKEEVLEGLRQNGTKAAAVVAGLSDEQLDRTGLAPAFSVPMSAQQVIENILINHIAYHLDSIKAAVGR